jgi:hypothetical protein
LGCWITWGAETWATQTAGRDDGGDAVVALVHEAEEGVGLFRLEGEIADLIDDQRLQTAQTCEQTRRGAIGQRGIELVEQRLGIVEAAAVAVEAGFAQEPKGYSGLAGGGPMSRTLSLRRKASEGVDLRLADAGLAFEREGVERPPPRQMGLIEAVGEAALASRRCHLPQDERLQAEGRTGQSAKPSRRPRGRGRTDSCVSSRVGGVAPADRGHRRAA